MIDEKFPDFQKKLERFNNISNPGIGFYPTFFVYTAFPHKKIEGLSYKVHSRWFDTTYVGHPDYGGVPYGSAPRLIVSEIVTRAIQQKSNTIELDKNFTRFLSSMGYPNTGSIRNNVMGQFQRLTKVSLDVTSNDPDDKFIHSFNDHFIKESHLWWENLGADGNYIVLSDNLFNSIKSASFPFFDDVLLNKEIRKSPLALDIFFWIVHKMHHLDSTTRINYYSLLDQFGSYSRETSSGKRVFKSRLADVMKKIEPIYPALKGKYILERDFIILNPTKTLVPKAKQIELF